MAYDFEAAETNLSAMKALIYSSNWSMDQTRDFYCYFIGALASQIAPAQWTEAMQSGQKFVEGK